MKCCPYCGSKDIEYIGIDDGGGDYGNAIEDTYSCWSCSAQFSIYIAEEYTPMLEGVDRFVILDDPDDDEIDEDELKSAWDDFLSADSFPF